MGGGERAKQDVSKVLLPSAEDMSLSNLIQIKGPSPSALGMGRSS